MAVSRPTTPYRDESDRDDDILVPGIPLISGAPSFITGESQGGTTLSLSLRTPKRLRGPPGLVLTPTPEPLNSPKP
jgi:hypothetical protein